MRNEIGPDSRNVSFLTCLVTLLLALKVFPHPKKVQGHRGRSAGLCALSICFRKLAGQPTSRLHNLQISFVLSV